MKKIDPAPVTTPENLPDFDSAKVENFLGEARVKQLKGVSNGRYNEHMQAACNGCAKLSMAVLYLLRNCGVEATPNEIVRLRDEAVATASEA